MFFLEENYELKNLFLKRGNPTNEGMLAGL